MQGRAGGWLGSCVSTGAEPGSPSPAPQGCMSSMRLSFFLAWCNGKGTRTSAVWGGGRDTPTSLFQPNSHPKDTQDSRSHPRAHPGICWPGLMMAFRDQPSAMTKPIIKPCLRQLAHN